METVGCALAPLRKVAGETDNALVRSFAFERESICDAARILFTPYAPAVKKSRRPKVFWRAPRRIWFRPDTLTGPKRYPSRGGKLPRPL